MNEGKVNYQKTMILDRHIQWLKQFEDQPTGDDWEAAMFDDLWKSWGDHTMVDSDYGYVWTIPLHIGNFDHGAGTAYIISVTTAARVHAQYVLYEDNIPMTAIIDHKVQIKEEEDGRS